MRVEGPKSPSGVARSRASAASGKAFALPSQGSGGAGAASSVPSGVAGVHSLDAILALQSFDTEEDRARRAVRHGHDLLDQLEALRADLLAGHISPQRLGALVSLARARQSVADPALSSLIADISLRARVELAKLGIDP